MSMRSVAPVELMRPEDGLNCPLLAEYIWNLVPTVTGIWFWSRPGIAELLLATHHEVSIRNHEYNLPSVPEPPHVSAVVVVPWFRIVKATRGNGGSNDTSWVRSLRSIDMLAHLLYLFAVLLPGIMQ
jgi:hypothetical protein